MGAPAGDHLVRMIDSSGLIPNSAAAISVPLNIASVSPSSNLNYLGGDMVTISGNGFSTDFSVMSVVFDDGTACNILSATDTQLVCETEEFSVVD